MIHFREFNRNLQNVHGIKCKAYDLIKTKNDEFTEENNTLKTENFQLKLQVEKLKIEMDYLKEMQFRSAKPFIDLTSDVISDDSDVEIVECPAKKIKLSEQDLAKKNEDIIILDLENAKENPQSSCHAEGSEKKSCNLKTQESCTKEPSVPSDDSPNLIDFEQFQNFLLDQIPNF
jgi:hypothetical protein